MCYVGACCCTPSAVIRGRRLTLIDLARAWPDAQRVRAPLKALDRLAGNPHLQGERYVVYHVMARWLVRNRQPIVGIDWSDLKQDGSSSQARWLEPWRISAPKRQNV